MSEQQVGPCYSIHPDEGLQAAILCELESVSRVVGWVWMCGINVLVAPCTLVLFFHICHRWASKSRAC